MIGTTKLDLVAQLIGLELVLGSRERRSFLRPALIMVSWSAVIIVVCWYEGALHIEGSYGLFDNPIFGIVVTGLWLLSGATLLFSRSAEQLLDEQLPQFYEYDQTQNLATPGFLEHEIESKTGDQR